MLNRRWMLLSLALASLMFVNPVSAQSYSVVSAESNLSSTNLTVDFSGLQADSEYELNYQPQGGSFTPIQTFTTSGTGSASVEFRHQPFTRNQDYLDVGDKGWLYRVETPPDPSLPDSQYSFTVTHGNMLLGLDTFNDGSINTDLWSNTGEATEVNDVLRIVGPQTDYDLEYDRQLSLDSVFKAEIIKSSEEYEDSGFIIDYSGGSCNLAFETPGYPEGNFTLGYDSDLNEIYAESSSTYNSCSVSNPEYFQPAIRFSGFNDNNFIEIEEVSVVSEVSRDAWVSPNQFDPAQADLTFGDVILSGSNVGLEYSADGQSWGSTPPSGLNDDLFYRNTGGGTLNFTATETGQAFQNLEITALTPLNNTVYPIPSNDSLPVDFEYDVFYGEDVESSVTWTLSNGTADLSSTIYPDLDAPIDRSFTESATVPIGDYDWAVSVSDSSLGASGSETFSFSVISEENATVSFDLISPSSGEEVSAEDGVDFQYEVQAENSGTLNLWIPEQSMTSPQFSETLGSGTTSRTVNLDVPSGSDLSWYLTFEEDSTGDVYTSQSVQFTTAESGTEPAPDQGFQISIPDLFFNAMSQFGFNETSAGYLVAILLILLLSTVGFVLGGTFGGSAGMSLALVLSAIVGFLPAWVVLVVVFLAGGVTAYYVGQAVSGGD